MLRLFMRRKRQMTLLSDKPNTQTASKIKEKTCWVNSFL